MTHTPSRGFIYLIILAITIYGCSTERQPRTAESSQYTLRDFQKLRWLEGTWRGTKDGAHFFYEGYHVRSDTFIAIDYYTDSNAVDVRGTGSVSFWEGGIVYHETGDGLWYLSQIDSSGFTFEPLENVTNSFIWSQESPDKWLATIRNPGQPDVMYTMERMQR